MARRLTGLLAAAMAPAVMLLAAACTGSSSSPRVAGLTSQQVLPLFVECLAEHDVPILDKAQGSVSVASVGRNQGWYENGRVVANHAFYANADGLEGFYPVSPDFRPEQMIGTWVDNAVSSRTWPKACAPLPAGS